jgi:hypothetical protein
MTDKSLLKTTLLANAGFSTICAAICLSIATPLARFIGLEEPLILTVLGIGLLTFAVDLAWTATRPRINRSFTTIIIAADIGWVLGSAVLLIFFSDILSVNGQLLIELIALMVAGFATVQIVALRRERMTEEVTV